MNCSFNGDYMRNYYDARVDWDARGRAYIYKSIHHPGVREGPPTRPPRLQKIIHLRNGDGAPRDFQPIVFYVDNSEQGDCFIVDAVRARLYRGPTQKKTRLYASRKNGLRPTRGIRHQCLAEGILAATLAYSPRDRLRSPRATIHGKDSSDRAQPWVRISRSVIMQRRVQLRIIYHHQEEKGLGAGGIFR